jgi:hypothetical protein
MIMTTLTTNTVASLNSSLVAGFCAQLDSMDETPKTKYAYIRLRRETKDRLVGDFGSYSDTADAILRRLMDERESCHCQPLRRLRR